MLNALIITPWYGGTQGGVAVATESLAHALLEAGGDCAIIMVVPDGFRTTTSRGSAGEEIVKLCVRTEASRAGSLRERLGYHLRAWNAERIMRRLIRAHNLRVAHFNFTDPGYDALMRLARRLGLGIVTTFHGAEVNVELQNSATSAAVRAMIRSSDRITVVSKSLYERVATSMPEARTALTSIPNAVPTAFVRATSDPAMRSKEDRRWDVLVVGRLIHLKGGDILLDALAEIVRVLPHIRVAFAGTGDLETALREQATRLGVSESVDFLGNVSRGTLLDVYRQSRILAVPSRSEGLPLVLLEAQWLGIPAIAAAVGGLPEAIADEVNGLLVPAEDPHALARALIRALSDGPLYERLRANALRIAAERFSPASMARRFQEVYGATAMRREGADAVQARPRAGESDRRVLMIVSAFPPSVEMGAQTCWQIARNLPGHGWTPIVVTTAERHTEYSEGTQAGFEPGFPVVRTGTLPHPLSLVRRVRAAQKAGGEEAAPHDAPVDASVRARAGLRRAVLACLNVPDTMTGWILPAVAAGRRLARGSDVACLFSSGPAWSSHLAGLALARLTGLPWVAHFRDPWSLGAAPSGEPRWADRMNARLERAVVQRAATVICVTEQHAALLRRHYAGCPPEKFVTISNGYDGAEWERLERDPRAGGKGAQAGRFVITYAGSLYVGRSPLLVLEALRRLVQAGELSAERVCLDLILYDGVRHLPDGRDMMAVAAEMGLGGSLRILGPFPRDETLRRLLDSDVLLLLGHNLTLQIPGKLYEYLRSGRPILALAPPGAQTELLRATGGAWIVEPDDVDGAVEAIRDAYQRWLSGRPGPRADTRLVSGFDRRVLVGRFADELDAAVSRAAKRRGRR